ncbi:hypothetical protein GCM10009804_73570 [Kribbella hippodromi]|uniref:Uncharacterized protein n=1 Tax=Kribbella hippodromi TaxID=434347 RepID=A0ABP4QH22_9ACTN
MAVSELRGRRGGDDPSKGDTLGDQAGETRRRENETSQRSDGDVPDQQASRRDAPTPDRHVATHHETLHPFTAREKSEQRHDDVHRLGNARGASAEQGDGSIGRHSADGADRDPKGRQEDWRRASADPRLKEAQASETESGDEQEAEDGQSSRPLTAREKLEQRLDEMYWPGYSKWSSTERSDEESAERRPVDPPSATAMTPADDRLEPKDPFASYSPELRAHLLHDDTLARLQYLSPPDSQAESTSRRGDSPRDAELGDRDTQSEADQRGETEVAGSAADDRSSSTAWLPSEAVVPDNADRPRRDDPPNAVEFVETRDRERDVHRDPVGSPAIPDADDVAVGTDSVQEQVADVDGPVEAGHEFVEDATTAEMDQYRRIREADDLDALAENSGMPREVIDEAKQHLFQRQHDVAIGPAEVRHGYFTPFAEFGDLWERVASGDDLTDGQRQEFRSLLAHEYVESKLMQAGVPYKSADPGAWTDAGMARVSMDYPSAHNIAPLSAQSRPKDLLRLWDDPLGLPRGDLRVAEDLSNLDEVVRVAKKGLGL